MCLELLTNGQNENLTRSEITEKSVRPGRSERTPAVFQNNNKL